jgi:hypothetical protein
MTTKTATRARDESRFPGEIEQGGH